MIHATGKVANNIVDGLKRQPLALPLVIINVVCLAVVGYVLHEISERASERDKLITELAMKCKVEPMR